MNQPEAALPPADRALTLDNRLPLGWFALGLALRGAGDPRSARQAFERAAELDPKFAAVHVQLGGLYDEFDDTLASERDWLIALELNARDISAHLALSTLYCRAERFDLGRAHAEKALDLDPELIGAHQNLALIEAREGRESEAKRHRDFAYGGATCSRRRRRGRSVACSSSPASITAIPPTATCCRSHRYTRHIWFVEYAGEGQTQSLPRYDVVFNAIGDPDGSAARAPAHRALPRELQAAGLQPPRQDRAHRAAVGAGAVQEHSRPRHPQDRSASAAGTEMSACRLSAPLLMRPLGSHGGFGLELVKTEADLQRRCGEGAASRRLLRDRILRLSLARRLLPQVPDVLRRPPPLSLSPGDLGPLACALRPVAHARYPERLAEERRFLDDPERALGKEAYETIRAVGQRLDLEFAGVDFSLTPEGAVVLFEANATMLVHTERPDSPLAHKNASTERILQAFWTMLESAAPKSVC